MAIICNTAPPPPLFMEYVVMKEVFLTLLMCHAGPMTLFVEIIWRLN